MQPFRIVAGEDQILTQEDIDEADRVARAQQRSQVMEMFFAADLDGDLNVTVSEWRKDRTAAPGDSRRTLFGNWDENKDEVATVEEVYNFAKTSYSPSFLQRNLNLSTFMTLEAAQDGKLTAFELEQAGRTTYRQYDVDNDGMLAPSELERFIEVRRKHQQGQGSVASHRQRGGRFVEGGLALAAWYRSMSGRWYRAPAWNPTRHFPRKRDWRSRYRMASSSSTPSLAISSGE